MEQILEKLLFADSKVVQQGSIELKEAFQSPDAVPALCEILVSSKSPQIRQTAAVVLRRRLAKRSQWSRLDSERRKQIKQGLLQALVSEQEKLVKNSIAQFIGLIGKHEFPQNRWPEILQFLHQLCASDNMLDKELGMYTLSIMTEISPSSYLERAEVLAELFTNLLNTVPCLGSNIAYYTVLTMKHIVSVIGGHQQMVNTYHNLLPRVLEVIGQFSQTDAKRTNEMLELFDDMIEYAVGAVLPHVRLIVESCLALACNDAIDTSIQIKAIGIVGWLIRSKSKVVQKHKLIEPIIDVTMKLMAQKPADEVQEEFFQGDPDQFTTTTIAAQTLDVIAIHMPAEKLVPLILARIEPALLSNDMYAQKAVYLSLAILAEGCADHIRTHYLEAFLKCIYDGIRNPNVVVRNAAFFALGQFSEFLQPEISQYASELLPVFFDYLTQIYAEIQNGKTDPPGLDRMFYALQTFCMHLDEGLLEYLPTLMDRVFVGLDPANTSLRLKRMALSTLDSIACAVKSALVPYFSKIFNMLNAYINADPNSDLYELLSYALECLSSIIDNIDGENFKPLAQETLQVALKILLETDDPDVRKSLFQLFAALSNIMKSAIAPALPKIIEEMIKSLKSTEGIGSFPDDRDGADLYESDSHNEDEEDIDSQSDASDDSLCRYTVENSYNDEKEQACLSLTEIAKHTADVFIPFLQPCFEEILELLVYPHADIRNAAVLALEQFCITLFQHASGESLEALSNALNMFIPKCTELIHADEEQNIAITCINAYGNLLQEMGSAAIAGDGHKEAIINSVVDILTHKTVCQDQDGEIGGGGADETGESEQSELLLECAGDVIPKFARALSSDEFVLYFANVLHLMSIRAGNKSSVSQRSFAFGTLAECMMPLGLYIEKFLAPLLELWNAGSKDSSSEVRNNAVFGLGEMILHGKTCVFSHYNDILRGLSSLIAKETNAGVMDNICGALAKQIINNSSIIPFDSVFPVFLQHLPLKQDFEENEAIINCFITLYQQGNQVFCAHLPAVIKIVIDVCGKKQSSKEQVLNNSIEFLKKINEDFPQEFMAVVNEIGPAGVHNIHTLLSR